MPLEQVRQRLIETFARWGKPGAMRVDNGLPLGAPSGQLTPVLALWLIGIDVDMIWNKPHCPQQNGRVEKMQDTTARWAEINKAADLTDLQLRLQASLVLQRTRYPVHRLAGKSRLAAYPTLETSRRAYSPADFSIERVYCFLMPKLYTRKVSVSGQIVHFGKVYSVGLSFGHQWVQLRLRADGQSWQVLSDYKVVKELAATTLTEQCIQKLTVFQRTKHQT
ncbi:hypothetical protein [Spirosoma foliorum]|uniref:Integrase catalytic domain-containing protein n=1 Tax=Spirosoma foliorum TaxID=2710596 RepID=A0A7G5H0C8_9BACT|nr:hypothetical protein [Spirosoma foliorum]QMW04570.1 hypothetical protein H3H32_06440 [Spirosoma foliorum]QMW05848.1 hypothetical protein H3H32_13595 [Spirosoma foliorum]QMW06705.1 hypothetical protein H3H32_18335 [Spirosoma foliorum]